MPEFRNRLGNIASHESAGQDEESRPVKPTHGPDSRGNLLFSYNGYRIYRDRFSPDVVTIGFRNRAGSDLGYLGAAADDDDTLSKGARGRRTGKGTGYRVDTGERR